jgi:hypothetical protein
MAGLDAVEAYRCGQLWYWLTVIPPERLRTDGGAAALLDEEKVLLQELRGARFIRLLPYLPMHYRRYGFRVDEAAEEPPEGAREVGSEHGAGFDPFDQDLAVRELAQTCERLRDCWERMKDAAPRYAAKRLDPRADVDEFSQALRSHCAAGRSAES